MTDKHRPDQTEMMDGLVQAAKDDRTAFGRLFDEFHPVIFAYCMRRLVVRAVAEDVTSEVFLKVACHIREFIGITTEDFRRWLFRIATNEINAHLRQSIRRRELLEAAVQMGKISPAVSSTLLDDDSMLDWQLLYEALAQLTEREQAIISLRFFACLGHSEISRVLKIRSGAIRVALSRALKKLRKRLCNRTTVKSESPAPDDGGR